MGKTLYLECSSGISGDMTVGALLDLGADSHVLCDVLNSIKAEGFRIEISKVKKSGLDCTDFNVILDKEHDGHDHDMEYLYGHLKDEAQEAHHHEHHHEHHSHDHHHSHRGLKEVCEIIDSAAMTESARTIAKNIFNVIAQAESKAHGVPLEEVHFHEVGAIDSIVDVIAIAVCLDNLQVEEVIVPKLYEGQGTVRCQHGVIPVPVPAVANIVSTHNIKLQILDIKGELVTPTGAATVAAIRTSDTLPEEFTIEKIGMGAGKRDYGLPGVVRAMFVR